MVIWHSAYLCAKCKVLFDTITIYDEHLESCKNNPENYNFDEVLEKLRFDFKKPTTTIKTKIQIYISNTNYIGFYF